MRIKQTSWIICLLLLGSITPIFGQETAWLRSAQLIIHPSASFQYPIAQLSRYAQANTGTLAAQVASTELLSHQQDISFEKILNTTWPARAMRAQILPTPALTVQQAAQLLLNNTPLESLSEVQRKDFFLTDYPALLLESPFLIESERLEDARKYYRKFLNQHPGTSDLEDWAQNMAAVSDLGLLGTPADAQLLLENAQKNFPVDLQPWTDLITARALLNLEAPEAVKTLANFRMEQFRKYNQKHPFAITRHSLGQNVEIPLYKNIFDDRLDMTVELQTVLAKHNPYNLFHISSWESDITENWRLLHKNLAEKIYLTNQALQRPYILNSIHNNLNSHLQQQAATYVYKPYLPPSPGNPVVIAEHYSNPALWTTEVSYARKRLLDHAQIDKENTLQEITQKEQELRKLSTHHSPQDEARCHELITQLAVLQEQYEAALAQFDQVQKELANGTPVDRISYRVYGYPLSYPQSAHYTTDVHFHNGQVHMGPHVSFSAPVASKEEVALNQALLNRAEEDIKTALQRLEQISSKEEEHHAQIALQNAANRWQYIRSEMELATPYATIIANAYANPSITENGEVWPLPPLPMRFEGRGEYPSFEALVAHQEEGYAKQEVLQHVQRHYFSFKQQAYIYQQEINLLNQDTRLLGRAKRQALRQDLQNRFDETIQHMNASNEILQVVQEGIVHNTPVAQLIAKLYGESAAQPQDNFWFRDASSDRSGFYAPVSSLIDGQEKQYFLDELFANPALSSYTKDRVRWAIQAGQSLHKIRLSYLMWK